MKNLKKVLALVLVLASLMGLATMASATTSDDYSDGDSITHLEAVDVMSTIGVFDGISGAFSGDSILTREQAAKIITYMILGKDDADALVASVAPYTDVSRDRWSAGSIAYCKNAGILAGVGNGRFEPDGKLTGVAFAKMCLVALGYDPDVEILTGPQWAVNTSSLAIAGAGISANLSQISLADEMTREDACQMAFNTLKADLVRYNDRGTNIVVNNGAGADISISSKPSKAEPVTLDTARVGEQNSIGNIKKEAGDGVLQFGERYFSKLTNTKGTGTDSFGRPATTWQYKSEEIGTYVDSAQLVKSWTAKAPRGELYSAIGSSIVDNLGKENDVGHKEEYRFTVWCDGKMVGKIDEDTVTEVPANVLEKSGKEQRSELLGLFFDKNSTKAAGFAVCEQSANIGVSGNGVQTELYMDDEDNVTVVMINTYLVQATSDYNSSTERVSIEVKDIDESTTDTDKRTKSRVLTNFLPAYIEKDDVDFDITGVKEDDYLLVTVSNLNWTDTTKKASIEDVKAATVQTGTVTEYTEKDNVTVGGTKYSYNKILGENEKNEEFAINSEAALILDTYGYIMKVDDAITSSNFVYVTDAEFNNNTLQSRVLANAYFTDGTGREITITKCEGTKKTQTIKDNVGAQGKWFVFSGGSNNEYVLNIPNSSRYKATEHAINENPTVEKNELIKSSNVKFLSNAKDVTNSTEAAKVRADDKTIFVIKDCDDDVTAYTGIANVPSVTLEKSVTYTENGSSQTKTLVAGQAKVHWICKQNSSDYASYVFIDVSKVDEHLVDIDGGNTTADYMFILKATRNKTHVDGNEYYKYTVVIDGKEEERWISDTIAVGSEDDNGRLFYNVREDGNGYITSGKEVGKDGSNRTRYLARMDFKWNSDGESMYKAAGTRYVYAIDGDARIGAYTIENDSRVINYKIGTGGNKITKNGSSVLNIPVLAGISKGEVIVNSKSTLNLVISKHADELLSKDGSDYDAYLGTSINNITSTLDGYNLAGRVYLITTDDEDSSTVDTLWIYVDEVKKA